MKTRTVISAVFGASTIYDGVLGLAFLFAAPPLFEWCGVTPPNHFGYVQFPSALLVIFALMFAAIARDPMANRNLMPYGILLKLAYSGIVFYYWFTIGIPTMWKPFAFCDLVFMALFAWAYVSTTVKDGKDVA
ncbi:MAG TPA: hypothetical protein VJL29_15515 [Thermoguttaceae bacterium]|nr:hypothetical protein [Thermoguttaceae bacterium]